MIEELSKHGYDMSHRTLYPILHSMKSKGLLEKDEKTVDGKIRKYYKIISLGNEVLQESKKKAYELFKEIKD